MPHDGQVGIVFRSGPHKLLGTLFLGRDDTPKPTALLLHGIPGIEKNYDIAHALRDTGWNSLIFHYRGSWGSEGDYLLETIPDDVQAALDALSGGAYPQVNPQQIGMIGHSLGGWAAVLAAARDSRIKAVAVYGAVTDPRSLPFDAKMAETEFTPWLRGITPQAFEEQWRRLDERFIPVEQVARIAPRRLLILHGGADTITPVEQAEILYRRAGEPRQLILHPEANHSFTWHRPWLREQILKWLADLDWLPPG